MRRQYISISFWDRMRKILSLLLLLVTVFVLTSCGGKASLTLEESDKAFTLQVGQTRTITPVVKKVTELEWQSSSAATATVSKSEDTLSATITALEEGTAKITVTVAGKELSEEITVTVTRPAPTSVTITGAGDLVLGGTLQLSGTVAPTNAKQTLTWSSSDTEVATVSNAGLVTAVKAGSVTITATSVNSAVKANVTVDVVAPLPTTVTVTGPNEVMVPGTIQLVSTVDPSFASQAVIWSVDKSSVATISTTGVLTALTEGTVVVTATSVARTTVSGTKSVSVTIPAPTGITISGKENVPAEETATYTAVVAPLHSNQTVKWSVSDTTKATINEDTGVLTAVAAGDVKVIATSAVLSTVVAKFDVTIDVANMLLEMNLDGGYWPITGTDAFIRTDPVATLTTSGRYNSSAADYYVSATQGAYLTNMFVNDADYVMSPSVWQNRAFLNRNENGFFEVELVKLAGSANANPTLSDYEYILFAHEAHTPSYSFIGALQVGQIITFNGFDINSLTGFDMGQITVNVYNSEQAVSTGDLSLPGGVETVLPVPGKLGAKFEGWYLNEEFTGEPVTTTNASIEVFAKWSYDYKNIAVAKDVAENSIYYSELTGKYYLEGVTLFDNLEDALEALEEGGTLVFEAGTHTGSGLVDVNNVTIKAVATAEVATVINVAANVEGLTIDGVNFTDKAQVVMAEAGGVKDFTFKNNTVSDLTIANGTFISFKNDGTANNEDFVIENNEFLLGEATDVPRWIRGGNILNFTIVDNVFEGIPGIYVDAIRIEGTNETNSAGIGVGGEVLITGNLFDEIGQRGLWFRRISATLFHFENNILDQTGGATAGGGLQLEVLAPDTVLEVNIIKNEFKNITHYFGIRLGTADTPTLGEVTIRFNKFIDFTTETAYYIQAYENATKINANQNFYTVLPTAADMPNVNNYEVAFDDLDDLADAIAMAEPQTIEFESNGGSEVASQEVPGGTKATKPEDPTRLGYTFAGWFKESALTNKFDFDVDVVAAPTTVYAKWTAVVYDLTYEYNGGELAFETQEEMFIAFLTDFHTFVGSTDTLAAFMDDEATTEVKFDGTWQSKTGDPADFVYLNKLYSGYRPDAPVAESEFFIEDEAYYAKWMPFLDMIQSFVKVVNSGQNFWSPSVVDDPTFVGLIRLPQFIKGIKPIPSLSDAVMAQLPAYTTENETYTIVSGATLPTPVKEGYVFAGWYDNAELLGEPMYAIPTGLTGEMTLTAKWVADAQTTGTVIVNPDANNMYFGSKLVIGEDVFEVGLNYFANLVDAAKAFAENTLVLVHPGVYEGDFAINVSDIQLIGVNAFEAFLGSKVEGASVIDGVITLNKELEEITIAGFNFVGQSQIVNTKGTAGTTTVVTTNLDAFTFAYNHVETDLASGEGFIYFTESANSYSNNLMFAYNYFTVKVEASELVNMIRIDNNAGLFIANNVFENIPGIAFFLNDTTKGLAGDSYISENEFTNVGAGIRINWLSPLPSTTMELIISNNMFTNVEGTAIYVGKMNNTDTIGALHVLENTFTNVDGGVHLARVHATANALVNYNRFHTVPTTFYVQDEKTASVNVTLDATKNAYLEDGAIIVPEAAKFLGAPDYTNPLNIAYSVNAYEQLEVSTSLYELNTDKLREEWLKDWNAMFETEFKTLDPTAFFNSAVVGAGGNTTKDVSDSNIFKFFHDEDMRAKWLWLIDFLQTKGGIHPQRQLIAIKGDGTSPDPANPDDPTKDYQLWNLSHSVYSFANFFNQKADTNGWEPISFVDKAKYDALADFNNVIKKNFENYGLAHSGQVLKLPVAPEKVNYEFVEYALGETKFAPGDEYTVSDPAKINIVYTAVKHDVTFFDGETEMTTLAAQFTHEAAYTLPTPTKEGYLFQGWFDNALLEGTAVTAVAKGTTVDKVFYAKWLLLEYVPVDVTFELNGGLTGAYVEATRYSTAGDGAGAAITVGTARGGLYWYVIGMKATEVEGIYEVVGKGAGFTDAAATLYLSYHDGSTSPYKATIAAEYAATVAGDKIYIPWLPEAVTATTSIDVLFLDSTITSVTKEMLLPAEFDVLAVNPNGAFLGWYDNAEFTGEPVASYPGFEDESVTAKTYYAKWDVEEEVELQNIMISQAYGGGGNNGATYKNDFIELYNPNDVDVDLTGWSIQYASATGLFASYEGNKVVLSGTIKAKSFFLIQAAAGSGGTEDLPTPDFVTAIAMGGSSFKIALANDDVTVVAVTDENVVDLVGAASNASVFEGTAPAPAPSVTLAVVRATLTDTNDNAADFTTAAPNPRNSTYVPE